MTAQELNTEFVEVKDAAYRYAASLLHNREEAEDLVQDLYEKLWRRRLLVRHKGFVQLVMVSVRNMCMDILRARKKSWEGQGALSGIEGLSGIGGEEGSGVQEVDCSWEDERERIDMAAVVEKLVERLPQREREAFHLRVVEGLDYDTAAEIMGINGSAVRMACSRARSKIKEELVKIMDYGVEREKGR
jgi:RNA polymerase sigma-70 factor (ECF subfamily)